MKKVFIGILGTCLILGLVLSKIFVFTDGETSAIKGQVLSAISFTPEEAKLYKMSLEDTLKSAKESTKNEIDECDDKDRENELRHQLGSLQRTDIDEMFERQSDGSIEMRIPHGNVEVIIDGTTYKTDEDGFYLIENEAKIKDILEREVKVSIVSHGAVLAELSVFFDKNTDNNEIKNKKTFMEFAEGAANM
jgi:hypothetical protein